MPAVVTAGSSAMPSAPAAEGRIEIALAGGDRVIVNSMVDATALARVIKVRIPMIAARDSDLIPATRSDVMPATCSDMKAATHSEMIPAMR